MKTYAKSLGIAASLLSLSLTTCSRSPTLLVTVEDLPAGAQSLQVIATHMGLAAITDLDPLDIPQPTPATTTFLLRLPPNFTGDVSVNVGAFMGAGATGCMVGQGTATDMTFAGPDDTLRVPLTTVTDTACGGGKLTLSSAMAPLGNTNGNETITLSGWGFKPGAKVTFGTTAARTVKYVSASDLQVVTPAKAGFGPTTIKVTNPDNSGVSRSDIFRFYADTVDFTGLPFPQMGDFSNVNGFAFGIFDPTTTLDAAVVTPASDYVRIVFTTNATTLTKRDFNLAAGSSPTGLVAADFNKDGFLDVAINTATTTPPKALILLNDGKGNLRAGGSATVGVKPDAMASADVNNDGFPDLVVANHEDGINGGFTVLLGDGQGGFKGTGESVDIKNPFDPVSISLGDFNLDGQIDIVTVNANDGGISVVPNDNGSFANSTRIGPYNVGMTVRNVVVADINNDGKIDVVAADPGTNQIAIIENRGGANILPYNIATEMSPQVVKVVDINGDGYPDLVVPCKGSTTVDIFVNKGGTGFKNVPYTSIPAMCPMPVQVAIYDIDRDGRPDAGVLCSAGVGLLINHSGL